jgi:hypothetical protein
MKNLKYCRVGSAYRILLTTSGFCVRTAQRSYPLSGNTPGRTGSRHMHATCFNGGNQSTAVAPQRLKSRTAVAPLRVVQKSNRSPI